MAQERKPAKARKPVKAKEEAPPPVIEAEPAPAPQAEPDDSLESSLTDDGRYIPYSGGSMGWFENMGVMKRESGNNYLFHTVMAGDRVRAKQFERWGQGFNRRGSNKRVRKDVAVTMITNKIKINGNTRDISAHGIRMQFFSEVDVKKGDTITIQLRQGSSKNVMVEAAARIVWIERIGKIRPVWNVGITMDNLDNEQSQVIQRLIAEQ